MKVVVSVPDPVFDAAERIARQRQVPRSQVFSEALEEYISRHGGESVTARLNEVYSVEGSALDSSLAQAQYKALEHETW